MYVCMYVCMYAIRLLITKGYALQCFSLLKVALFSGEYHQYDMCAYPKITKVQRSVYDAVTTTVKAGISFFSRLFRTKPPQDDVKEVDFKPPSMEELATQCLHFYLEPYKNALLQESGRYPMVNSVVRDIVHVFNTILKPAVKHFYRKIPESIKTVSITIFYMLLFYLLKN